jgi:anhydro-N-acetylmuramic acid kinase
MDLCRHQPYDAAGAWARSGKADPYLLERLFDDDYFRQTAPKSTGFEHFNLDWLRPQLPATVTPTDAQATLCELTAATIAEAVIYAGLEKPHLLICGGGVHNDYLMERLRDRLAVCRVDSTVICGIDPDRMEAMAFAWLARRTLHGQAGNLPSVTGARDSVVPGRSALREEWLSIAHRQRALIGT